MTARLPILLVPALFLFAGNAAAAPDKAAQPDIRALFNQFAISAAAANKCSNPSQDTISHFNANFRLVAMATSKEIAKQHPDADQKQISEAMKQQSSILTKKVFDMVAEKGCKDPAVAGLVQRFDMQAKWDPRKQAAASTAQKDKAEKK